jgi:hypothetical protein
MTRLKNLPTLHIDAERALSFTYRGKICQGLAGDTVATALYANGIRVFGRSLKSTAPAASTAWTESAPTPWWRWTESRTCGPKPPFSPPA